MGCRENRMSRIRWSLLVLALVAMGCGGRRRRWRDRHHAGHRRRLRGDVRPRLASDHSAERRHHIAEHAPARCLRHLHRQLDPNLDDRRALDVVESVGRGREQYRGRTRTGDRQERGPDDHWSRAGRHFRFHHLDGHVGRAFGHCDYAAHAVHVEGTILPLVATLTYTWAGRRALRPSPQ